MECDSSRDRAPARRRSACGLDPEEGRLRQQLIEAGAISQLDAAHHPVFSTDEEYIRLRQALDATGAIPRWQEGQEDPPAPGAIEPASSGDNLADSSPAGPPEG
jgi:hypothetical protein